MTRWPGRFLTLVVAMILAITYSLMRATDFDTTYAAYLSSAQAQSSESLQDFVYLGDNHLANFVSDDLEEELECTVYDECLHVNIFATSECLFAGELDFQLLDAQNRLVVQGSLEIYPALAGQMNLVEIGTNKNLDFEFYSLEEFTCKMRGLSA